MILSLNITASLDGKAVGGTLSMDADGSVKREIALPANSVNTLINASVPVANLKGIVLHADAAVTIKTNSSNAPVQTFVLAPNSPIVWLAGLGASPVTTDITALYASAAGIANLTIWFVMDATP